MRGSYWNLQNPTWPWNCRWTYLLRENNWKFERT